MRITRALCEQAAKSSGYKSLALSVHFKHPKFDMQEYEILSRATAFLLSVDPPMPKAAGDYGHMEDAERRRKMKSMKRETGFTPATPGGKIMDMGWLEFVPREHRPNVHVVASSHVFSPFLWKEYYPHDWLNHVEKEHCKYTLEVYDAPGNSVAQFPLNANPFHHPEGRDVALAHFDKEEDTLPLLRKLGVEILHLRSSEPMYERGEKLVFPGYGVVEPTDTNEPKEDEKKDDKEVEDTRVFYPHTETGVLEFHTEADDRFFASTPSPLPEGLCGAPVLDEKGACCGVVEGIVPVNHANQQLAGMAAFLPHYVMSGFVDFVERQMLRGMMPDEMFNMVINAKKTNSFGGGVYKLDKEGEYSPTDLETAYESMMKNVKNQCSKEEFDAYVQTMEYERKEIQRILNKEGGGDVSEVADRVRRQTFANRDMVHNLYRQRMQKEKAAARAAKKGS